MRRLHDSIITIVDNEDGMTMVVTLMILLLLSIIGVAAIKTSTTETMISSAETEKRSTFYAAESGAEHLTGILRTLCIPRNQDRISKCNASTARCNPKWNFALDGTEEGISAATTVTSSNPSWMEQFNAGALWITRDMGNGYSYVVRVWNKNDAGSAIDDEDGVIYLGAVGTGPHNGKAAVEVALSGVVVGSVITSYSQSSGGASKSSNATDTGRITDTQWNSLSAMAIP